MKITFNLNKNIKSKTLLIKKIIKGINDSTKIKGFSLLYYILKIIK